MKIIRVQYTVQAGYAATNQENIRRVMADLQALNNPNIKYSSFLLEDGKTFMHFAMYPDEETSQVVPNLASFQYFRKSLIESKPEVPPKAENLQLVGSAYEIFEKV